MWKLIWKLPVPVKVRNSMCKACCNIIATNGNLWRRKIKQSPLFHVCKKEEEIVEHVLLQCEWVVNVWFGLDVQYKMNRQQITMFDRWLGKFVIWME